MERTMRVGATAGAGAPYLFLLGTIGISWLQEDFMEELGWDVWPSGLALGPNGWLQMADFIVLGVLLSAFALAVIARHLLSGDVVARAGPWLVERSTAMA